MKKSDTDMNVKEADNSNLNSELIQRDEVKDTPFMIITIEDKGSFGALGEYRITETYKTKEAVRQEVEKITWNRVIQVMMIINDKMEKEEINLKQI